MDFKMQASPLFNKINTNKSVRTGIEVLSDIELAQYFAKYVADAEDTGARLLEEGFSNKFATRFSGKKVDFESFYRILDRSANSKANGRRAHKNIATWEFWQVEPKPKTTAANPKDESAPAPRSNRKELETREQETKELQPKNPLKLQQSLVNSSKESSTDAAVSWQGVASDYITVSERLKHFIKLDQLIRKKCAQGQVEDKEKCKSYLAISDHFLHVVNANKDKFTVEAFNNHITALENLMQQTGWNRKNLEEELNKLSSK